MARALRTPLALQPRIQDMDGVIRRQQKEIEGLRASMALMRQGGGGSWWNEADIGLKGGSNVISAAQRSRAA